MPTTQPIRWLRIALAGLLNELAMFAVVIPLNIISQDVAYYAVPFAAVGTGFACGWWAARPLKGRFVLHGALAMIVASLMYITLTTASGVAGEIPLLYHLSHGLRLLGGAAGGAFAGRRARTWDPALVGPS